MSDRPFQSSASSYYPACVALGVELRQNAGGGGWPALAMSFFWTMMTLVLRTVWVLVGGAERPGAALSLARETTGRTPRRPASPPRMRRQI